MALLNTNFSLLRAIFLVLGLTIGTQYKVKAKNYASSDSNVKFGIMGSTSGTAHYSIREDKAICTGTDLSATLFFEYKFTELFGLRTGVGYSRAVLESIKDDKKASTTVDKFRLSRLSIPIVARFYPGDERKFSVYAGPRLGWIRDGKKLLNTAEEGCSVIESKGKDIDDAEKGFYLSVDFGFDYETDCGIFLGMEGLGFAIGYNFGSLL
ncbi:outer membrane beta-barrel protein [Cardinium endosymbiont of Tipula unca]|uniref:outer membrane beta-barrel protein n=1 Tax=Cardinium endosymbiont of Tipula unca TaxID=3066216 RepID=UPI0030D22081